MDSNYSSSEDDSLYEIEEDMDLKQIIEGHRQPQKKEGHIGNGLSELQDTEKEDNSHSEDSSSEVDSDYDEDIHFDHGNHLIKKSRGDRKFKQRVRENKKAKGHGKRQKTKNTKKSNSFKKKSIYLFTSLGMVNSDSRQTEENIISKNTNHSVFNKKQKRHIISIKSNKLGQKLTDHSVSLNSIDVTVDHQKKPAFSSSIPPAQNVVLEKRPQKSPSNQFSDSQLSKIEEVCCFFLLLISIRISLNLELILNRYCINTTP
jgi:hypothetical protein